MNLHLANKQSFCRNQFPSYIAGIRFRKWVEKAKAAVLSEGFRTLLTYTFDSNQSCPLKGISFQLTVATSHEWLCVIKNDDVILETNFTAK